MAGGLSEIDLTIEEILDYEKVRYQRKGYGLVFATLIFLAWFFIVPQLAPYVWPYKIQDPGQFTAFSTYIIHALIFYLGNLGMWVIYKLEWDFFERYKTHDKAWPWKSDPEKWNVLIKKTAIILFVNQGIVLPLLIYGNYKLDNDSPFRTSYDSLPGVAEIIWQTVFCMFVEDFTFYCVHRFLHWDRIYSYIHKQHHHYINTVSIASEYVHPVEFVIGNVVPSNLGSILLGKRMHLFTVLMWITLRVFETTDGHCGYEFSWSPYRLLPMSGSSEYHNFHHLNFKGNYGSFFTIWDTVFKTINKRYQEFTDRKRQLLTQNSSPSNEKKIQ